MSAVTVTATIATTCNYWISPEPVWNVTGGGLEMPAGIQAGSVQPTQTSNASGFPVNTPTEISLSLDNSTLWDVYMEFQGAQPVIFQGLNVTGGGDLFELLSAQGWVSA